jgi:hypothetical protein
MPLRSGLVSTALTLCPRADQQILLSQGRPAVGASACQAAYQTAEKQTVFAPVSNNIGASILGSALARGYGLV